MTERSYFFDRLTGGDATLSPYETDDFSGILTEIYGTDFVVGGYMDNFKITSTGGADGSIWLFSGGGVCKGVFFESDDVFTITLSDQGGGVNRIDRVVLRYDDTAQTVRPYVIEGVAAATPVIPALTADDMPLWYIYVPDGFSSASTVDSLHLQDERVISHVSPLDYSYRIQNRLYNSEFMGYSQAGVGTVAPEGWTKSGAVPVLQGASALGNVLRGRAVDVQLGAGDTLGTAIMPLTPDADTADTMWMTLKGVVKPKTGDLRLLIWTRASGGGTTQVAAVKFTRLTVTHEFVIRFQVDTTTEVTIEPFWYTPSAATFEFGQMVLTSGLVPGPFCKKNEFIMFDTVLTDANWSADAYADTTTTISLNADFGGTILRDTKGLLTNLRVTSAANVGASLYAVNKVASGHFTPTCISGKVDTKQTSTSTQEQYAFVGITNTATRQFRLVTDVESGSQTFTAQIVGIWT